MGDIKGFLKFERREPSYEDVQERIGSFKEFTIPLSTTDIQNQASRCMDCGVPFCHTGCPLNNQIPDWNDLVSLGNWRQALDSLHATNNFPEFTGRTCPAPCEYACTLYLEDQPVTIKAVEQEIVDRGWDNGWIIPEPCESRTGKSVAVVGSGPAGMAAAQQLARVGHHVVVLEREHYIGGLLRYGIPDFKLEKDSIERRRLQLDAEGVHFRCNVNVGVDVTMDELQAEFDAVLIAIGAEKPRDVGIGGLEYDGVHYAMPYLRQQNKRVAGQALPSGEEDILAGGKNVVVIGGGDTASDCVGTAIRQKCQSVTQLDIRAQAPQSEDKDDFWPYWPTKMLVSSSQAEGALREFAVATLGILADDNNQVVGVKCARVDSDRRPLPDSEFIIPADLVLYAIGFAGPLAQPLMDQLNVVTDSKGNISANVSEYKSSKDMVFAAGDVRRGQSLVVWAIKEGRQAARAIDQALMGVSQLPR